MDTTVVQDVTRMLIYINELKSTFDRAMIEGETFENVKKIYLKIKALESQISVLQWRASTGGKRNNAWLVS